MRRKLLAAVGVLAAMAATTQADNAKGTPEIKSVTAMAFSPTGTLFVGDPEGAAVYAIDVAEKGTPATTPLNVEKLDSKIAGVIGAKEADVTVRDMKVNPATGSVYLAVTRGKANGTPALIRVTRAGTVEAVALKDVGFSKVDITNPFDPATAKDPKAKRGGRGDTITQLAFVDNKVVVAGLSGEEFASTLRTFPYPFKESDKGAGLQIYHGAHGSLETHAPIRSFVPYKTEKEQTILAAYTCTPLVRIPVADLKAGAKVKGKTIAELGNRNNPIDMITYTKDGKDYILMANTARGVMKIPTGGVDAAEPITAKTDVAGVKYETVADLKDVKQLDKLDDKRAILLVQPQGGAAELRTIDLP